MSSDEDKTKKKEHSQRYLLITREIVSNNALFKSSYGDTQNDKLHLNVQ